MIRCAEAAFSKGWKRLKLYFMIGLPTETDEDLEAIASLAERVRDAGRKYVRSPLVSISVGTFVPKPHTPFQWEPFIGMEEAQRRFDVLGARLTRGFRYRWHDPGQSFVEAVLSRGDRRLGRVIRRVWENGGRFDSWGDRFDLRRWLEALEAEGIRPEAFTDGIDQDEPLPWEHIATGVAKSWLQRERQKAYSGRTTADCRSGICTGCGLGCPPGAWVLQPSQRSLGSVHAESGRTNRRQGEGPSPEVENSHSGSTKKGLEGKPEHQGAHLDLRYRISFSKKGRLRFLSHLDTMRLLARLLRMADWPLTYTQGHNPHPRISSGPPLPVGLEGHEEYIDVRLSSAIGPSALAAVNRRAPEGLRLTGFSLIRRDAPSLSASAAAAEHLVRVPRWLAEEAAFEERLRAFKETASFPYQKARKGRHRAVNLKQCVLALEVQQPESEGSTGTEEPLLLHLKLRIGGQDGRSVAPAALLGAVFGLSPEQLAALRIARTALLDSEGTPLGDSWV